MKYIILILIVAGGYYLYENKVTLSPEIEVKTLKDIRTKLENSSVNSNEVIKGATELAIRLCEDNSFQEVVGESINSCKQRLSKFKSMCSESVFGKKITQYSNIDEVSSLAKRYVTCVST